MASNYNILMKRYNGVDWDILRPLTLSDNVDVTSQINQFVTSAQKTWLADLVPMMSKLSTNVKFADGVFAQFGGGGNTITIGNNTIKYSSSLGDVDFSFQGNRLDIGVNTMTNLITLMNDSVDFFNIQHITVPSNYVPSASNYLVDKKYVDNVGAGIKPSTAVKVASVGNLALTGVTAIDGYTLVNGDRVLLKDQTTATQNGIYTWATGGTLTKVPVSGNDNQNGTLIRILNGNTNKNDSFFCQNYTTGNWILFDSNLELIAGSGISVSGATISISNGGVTNAMLGGNIESAKLRKSAEFGAGTSGELIIAPLGITNAMLAGSIDLSKLNSFANVENRTWGGMSGATNVSTVAGKFSDIFSAIKLLRGTAEYKTNNTETIADAYTKISEKNKTTLSNANPSNTNRVVGDLHFQWS